MQKVDFGERESWTFGIVPQGGSVEKEDGLITER